MKKGSLFLTLGLALTALVGCGGGSSDKVKISVVKLGYGTDWLTALTEAYTAKTGTKFQIVEKVGQAGNNNLDQELRAFSGDSDIYAIRPNQFHKMIYQGTIKAKGQTYDCAFEDLTDIYTTPYEGESGKNTILAKMDPMFTQYIHVNDGYYGLPWANGFQSLVRNLDVWAKFGLDSSYYPRTTNEWFEMMDQMNTKISSDKTLKETAPMIFCESDEYYTSVYGAWFVQYEGLEGVQNFYNGRNPDGKRGKDLFTFDGITEALKVLDKIVEFSKETSSYSYQHAKSSSLSFTQMQNYFLLGGAALCVNGTWLEFENPAAKTANIDYIPLPLISSIVNRLSIKYSDEVLREMVTFVDAHPTVGDNVGMPGGVTSEDLEIVRESRINGSFERTDMDHLFMIPSWAGKKAEAKAFLKWCYSDEGLQLFYDTMRGHHLPATLSEGEYDSSRVTLSQFRQSVNNAFLSERFSGFMAYTRKDKMFSVAPVFPVPSNSISKTGNCLRWLIDGLSADQVVAENTAYMTNHWSSILNALGQE
jgi:ABC-type glycerol-3-phosphate transport system substrate-binding protein